MTRPYELPLQPEGGLRFDGSSGYVDCGTDSSLDITNNITIITTLKPISFHTFDGITRNAFYMLRELEKLAFRYEVSGIGWQGPYSNTKLDAGKIYHTACTKDDSYDKIYINGDLDKTALTVGTAISRKHQVIIDYDSSRYFNTEIYEVIIIAEVLTQSEIRGLMEGRRDPREWDCRLYLDLTQRHTQDISGNGNHGTRVGGTYWMP